MLRIALLSAVLWMSGCTPPSLGGNQPPPVRYPAILSCHPGEARVLKTTVPGQPFAAIVSPDGCWIFASLIGPPAGLAVFHWTGIRLELRRIVRLSPAAAGLALSHDGGLLVVADGRYVDFLDVGRLLNGATNALLGSIRDAEDPRSVYVAISEDDRTLFVSDEGVGTVTVFDLQKARRSGFAQGAIVGNISTGYGPIGLAFSRGGHYLFITSQVWPDHHGWPAACDPSSPFQPTPPGAVEVVDVARARVHPAEAVLGRTPASCSPVRAVLSPDGAHLYVSARGSNALLAFDAARLVSDPANALVTTVPVGNAPVGLEVVDGGQHVIVANSSRFGGPGGEDLMVVDTSKIGQGQASAIGTLPTGRFPRELHATPDGRALILTDFDSHQIELIPLARLPGTSANRSSSLLSGRL
jgi:DNA-binding beta-propeller fold protein YncE